jgi:hypothetical protein
MFIRKYILSKNEVEAILKKSTPIISGKILQCSFCNDDYLLEIKEINDEKNNYREFTKTLTVTNKQTFESIKFSISQADAYKVLTKYANRFLEKTRYVINWTNFTSLELHVFNTNLYIIRVEFYNEDDYLNYKADFAYTRELYFENDSIDFHNLSTTLSTEEINDKIKYYLR